MIESFFWNWQSLPNKFENNCVVCRVKIPKGEKVLWKKGIGISHIDCLKKYEELEYLRSEILALYMLGQNDKACAKLPVLMEMQKETNQIFFLDADNTAAGVVEWYKSILNNPDMKAAANKSKNTLSRKLSPTTDHFFDLVYHKENIKERLDKLSNTPDVDQEQVENIKLSYEKTKKRYKKYIVDMAYSELRDTSQLIFKPEKPIDNKIQYRKLINQAQKEISIIDKYFTNDSLDLLISTLDFDNTNVTEIKILTSKIRLKNKIDGRFKKLLENVKRELLSEYDPPIQIEIRVITTPELDSQIHNRYFLSSKPENSFDLGSRAYIFEQLNTISRLDDVKNDDKIDFEKMWDSPGVLDLIKDWDKLKFIICSVCKKQYEPHSNYSGPYPTCKECLEKKNRAKSNT